MVVSRQFFPPEKGMRRDFIFRGASTPSKQKTDYFIRYPDANAFENLTFKYTSDKPWLVMTIHCGTQLRQNPAGGKITVDNVEVPFVHRGNQYYNEPLAIMAYFQVPIGQEVEINIAMPTVGAATIGNGSVHIHEMTFIDPAGVLQQKCWYTNNSSGWSISTSEIVWEIGDLVVASIYSGNPELHPLYAYWSVKQAWQDQILFENVSLQEFELGSESYSAGGVQSKYSQINIDGNYDQISLKFTGISYGTCSWLILRGAID